MSYSGALGGAERILLDCAAGLERPVVLACPEGPLAAAAREGGIELAPVRRRSLGLRGSPRERLGAALAIAGLARELARLAERLDPAVVVAWSMRALLSCALARARPLVFQHNDLLPPGLAGAAVRRGAARADRVVCLSRAIADDLGLPAEVVPAGVDLQRFRPAEVRSEEPVAIMLGAIVGWKRPDLALEAAARLPRLRLRLAGEPLDDSGRQLLERLRRRAAAPDLAGRVELLGRVDDPAAALRGASFLLHCSDREPYGLALVEALACGVPVVAPAAGGPMEIVDESCGRLYPPGDSAGAAAAAQSVLADPSLRAGARERAELEFDVELTRMRFRELVETPA